MDKCKCYTPRELKPWQFLPMDSEGRCATCHKPFIFDNRLQVIPPTLIDKEDVKKIIEMNAKIVAINCATLQTLNTPTFLYKD